MSEQLELDFTGKRASLRPHFKTTTLTTNWSSFKTLKGIDFDVPVTIEFVNDIVSSCRGSGNSEDHHTIRRFDLLSRQFKGDYRKVNVRARQGVDVACMMLEGPVGRSDDCSCFIRVYKPSQDKSKKGIAA